jgi:hypothetical protein
LKPNFCGVGPNAASYSASWMYSAALVKRLAFPHVIAVGVREGDVGDVGGLHADLGELRDERLRQLRARAGRRRHDALGRRGERIGVARVPEHPALRVPDQVAVIAEFPRHSDVDAGRPARDVGHDRLAAVEDVHALHGRLLSRRVRGAGGDEDGSSERERESHRFLLEQVAIMMPSAAGLRIVHRHYIRERCPA